MGRSVVSASEGPVAWKAPGRGRWRLDTDHAERPARRAGQGTYSGVEAATAGAYSSIGLATRCIRIAYVHGWRYANVEMVDDAAELANLERRARTAVQDGTWREVVDEWFDAGRREFIDRCLAVQRFLDETDRDLRGLADVVMAAGNLATEGVSKHFALLGGYLGAGLFLERHEAGGEREQALSALAGASPGSREPTELAMSVADALGEVVHQVQSVADIREHSSEAKHALHRYLELFGSRSLDGSVDASILLERPDLIVSSIQAAHRHQPLESTNLDQVPPEVQRSYALRDDNVGITCNWTAGLLHRGITNAGQSLYAAGLLDDPSHAFHASVSDLAEACEKQTPGLNAGAAEAAAAYDVAATSTPPLVIDGERVRRTKPELPTHVARASSAMMAYNEPVPRQAPDIGLRGIGVGSAKVQGRAIVADDAIEALQRIKPGDILITSVTDSAFNILLTQVAGLVTEHGGAMSHAAILARELGIPAIIGVPTATARIQGEALIELDPAEGLVRVIDAAPPHDTTTHKN